MRGKIRVYLYKKGQSKVQKINTQKIQKIQKGNAQKIQKGNAQKIQKLRAVRADEETQKQQLLKPADSQKTDELQSRFIRQILSDRS